LKCVVNQLLIKSRFDRGEYREGKVKNVHSDVKTEF